MSAESVQTQTHCACGKVRIDYRGDPIASVICYCDDCQAGGRLIEALPRAQPCRTEDGGTPLVLFRRDRVDYVAGRDLLRPIKLKPGSPTKRNVASCCNTAMLVDFDGGPFWVSAFDCSFAGGAPPPEMNVQTQYRSAPAPVTTSIPSYRRYPVSMIARLLGPWIPMLLGRP
ncbi:GFA family protein [Devosia nitrariae]|uniref:CENP-V/GFA domain-containing protein n=1 Tax=Devosia nitrariae TaxID=2071872 RepID=A0ABQ5W2X5_9HYPH|nr:hypothetical protein [Devosia nitrariae]GLQ54198.1 hypothetical protein GCM10010862_14570 [Devosia nitrariae]